MSGAALADNACASFRFDISLSLVHQRLTEAEGAVAMGHGQRFVVCWLVVAKMAGKDIIGKDHCGDMAGREFGEGMVLP